MKANLSLILKENKRSKKTSLRVAILGTAGIPETREKIKMVTDSLGKNFTRQACWFSVIDRRQTVLCDLKDFCEQVPPPFNLCLIGMDLLSPDYRQVVDWSGGKYHLGIVHLTPDYCDEPIALVRNCFDLIEVGGFLVIVTKNEDVVAEVSQMGQLIGDVCWAEDIYFDKANTACLVVRKNID